MIRRTLALLAVASILLLLGMQSSQDGSGLPPGHPPTGLPPGHPPLNPRTPPAPPAGSHEAAAEDVESVESIVTAYYASISAPAGEERQWNRFRSLFMPGARLITVRPAGDRTVPIALSPEQYIATNDRYFQGGGYFEREVHREVDAFGGIAHVFSTYESRRKAEAPEAYSRGINSIQLFNDGRRWWIVTIMWDYERPGRNDLPAEYLPG